MMSRNPVLKRFKVPESNVFFMTRFRPTEYHADISEAVATAVADAAVKTGMARRKRPRAAGETSTR